LSVTCREIYASARALFKTVISVNGTSGGRVPYNLTPSVKDAVGKPGTAVGVCVAVRLSGNSVAVTSVVVRFGGGSVAVSTGRVDAGGVLLGFSSTGVGDGSGDGTGDAGAAVVGITAVGVANPGMGKLNEHAPRRSRTTNAGMIFFMAAPLSIRID
jgi:hypothetical protein